MNLVLKATPEVPEIIAQKIQQDVLAILQGSKIEKINTPGESENAMALIRAIKKAEKSIEVTEKSIVSPIKEKLDSAKSFFAQAYEALADASKNAKSKIREFDEEQERLAAERKALADKEEADRKAADEKAEEEKKRHADELALAAAAAQAVGNTSQAKALQEEIARIVEPEPAVFPPSAPISKPVEPAYKPQGYSVRKTYSAEILSVPDIIKWAIKTEAWELLAVDSKALNKLAGAKKEYFQVPGARLVVKETEVVR